MVSDDLSIQAGSEVIVFDSKHWNGRDVGDNSQFYHRAQVLAASRDRERVATIRWLEGPHAGQVSRGHFIWAMKKVG